MERQLQEVIQAFLQDRLLFSKMCNENRPFIELDQNLYDTKWEVIHHVVVKYFDRILNQFTKVHVIIVVSEQSFGFGFCSSIFFSFVSVVHSSSFCPSDSVLKTYIYCALQTFFETRTWLY